MKSEERHKLNQNELAEGLRELPQLWEKHGKKVVTIAIVAVVIVFVVGWMWNNHKVAVQARKDQLQISIVNVDYSQYNAAQQSQAALEGQDAAVTMAGSYDISTTARQLEELADSQAGSALGMMARLRQADALRSQLYFSDVVPSESEKTALCEQIKALYQQLLADYPENKTAIGAAKMGLALVAEDLGQWDIAAAQYEEIVALADTTLAGTIYPEQATRRLALIEEINQPIALLEPAPVAAEITAMPSIEAVEPVIEEAVEEAPQQ